MLTTSTDLLLLLVVLIGGEEETGHPSVVALVSTGRVQCSGTVVSPHAVATAAHRLAQAPEGVVFGIDPHTPDRAVTIASMLAHPDRDLAVLFLGAASTSTAPAMVRDDALGLWLIGVPLEMVGFGSGTKRSGSGRAGDLREQSFTVIPDSARACFGDSGGPVFVGGALAGVLSSGDPECERYARYTRLDGAFFEQAIALAEKTEAELGERCVRDESCSSGSCLLLDDGGRCATPCSSCREDSVCVASARGEGCVPVLSLPIEISGGCSALPGARSELAPLLLLALIASLATSDPRWPVFGRRIGVSSALRRELRDPRHQRRIVPVDLERFDRRVVTGFDLQEQMIDRRLGLHHRERQIDHLLVQRIFRRLDQHQLAAFDPRLAEHEGGALCDPRVAVKERTDELDVVVAQPEQRRVALGHDLRLRISDQHFVAHEARTVLHHPERTLVLVPDDLVALIAGGDHVEDAGEVCDDGNTADGDGCSASCGAEEACGNDVVDEGEECDDGNMVDWDGCTHCNWA